MSQNLKEVSGSLSHADHITPSLEHARAMQDEFDAIYQEPGGTVITQMKVYVVHRKVYPMKGKKIK